MENAPNAREALLRKYGDARVQVVCRASADPGTRGFLPLSAIDLIKLESELFPMLRREAELDENYLQAIAYVAMRRADGAYFVTRRLGGDARLTGKLSAGIGGHVEPGETILAAALREISEETNFCPDARDLRPLGFILLGETPVDRVHLGLAMICNAPNGLRVRETDKLEGMWLRPDEMRAMREQLEGWTRVLADGALA